MDFFEHQHQAKKKTKILVFYFVLAVALIVATINTVVFQLGNNFGQFQLTFEEWFLSPWFVAATVGTLTYKRLRSRTDYRGSRAFTGGRLP